MKFVCIGDSLTFGYGVAKNQCWTRILEGKFNTEVVNKGINGQLTSDMTLRYNRDVIQEKPDHVIIMGGTNDFLHGMPLNTVIDNIIFMVNLTLEKNIVPMIGIQMLTDPIMAARRWSDDTDYAEVNNKISLYREWAYNYSKSNNIKIFDFYDAFNRYLMNNSSDTLYFDGLHPTPEGHELMAAVIMHELLKREAS
ncbi:MAG: hypothetical protein GX285_01095 [Clostridiales bacterium]|nr:hypothetical protein [Clostridiales bacterium]